MLVSALFLALSAYGPIRLEIDDRTPKFLDFYQAAQGLDAEKRWEVWKARYNFAAVPPTPDGQKLARKLLDDAWSKYPSVLNQIKKGAAGLTPNPQRQMDRVAKLLGCKERTVVRLLVYVGGNEGNAFTAVIDGKTVVALPIEMSPDRSPLVMTHEFTHAVHRTTAHLTGSWERSIAETILAEGLAMHAVQVIEPKKPDYAYTDSSMEWLSACSDHEHEMLQGALPFLDKSDSETVAKFTFGSGATGHSREAYYLGWTIVGHMLARGQTLAQIAHIPSEEIVKSVKTEIEKMVGTGSPSSRPSGK